MTLPITRVGNKFTGSADFPSVGPEGSRWVDAGTVQALLYQLIGQLAGEAHGSVGPASLAIDVVALVPRERELRFEVDLNALEASPGRFSVVIYEGGDVVVVARGRV